MTLSLSTKIVVAGCGSMGLPMARALLVGGYDTRGFDVRPSSEFEELCPLMLESLQNLESADIALVVVRDQKQIDEVCFGQKGLYSGNSWPETLIISSTVSPLFITGLTSRIPANVTLIDAPMSGAPFSAVDRSLTFMLGGDKSVISDPVSYTHLTLPTKA